jgi:hypothetical protein
LHHIRLACNSFYLQTRTVSAVMAGLGISDYLSLVQSVVLIGALGVTLYFSRRQAMAQKTDLETATLANLDEKLHHLIEIFMEDPSLLKIIVNAPDTGYTRAEPTAYYAFSVCAHAYHMKQRGILSGNEWAGWLQWMKNIFQYGTLVNYWKGEGMENWFDPAFRDFVNGELLAPRKT